MKIALYIEDGSEQIVLTPETDGERSILEKLTDGSREFHIYRGAFYACRGGWGRWKEDRGFDQYYQQKSDPDSSTIIVLSLPTLSTTVVEGVK